MELALYQDALHENSVQDAGRSFLCGQLHGAGIPMVGASLQTAGEESFEEASGISLQDAVSLTLVPDAGLDQEDFEVGEASFEIIFQRLCI